MIEHKELITIYTQLSTEVDNTENLQNSYYIICIFNDTGVIEEDILAEVYDETYKKVDSEGQKTSVIPLGPFASYEALQNYAYKLCVELESPKIILNSVDDYNRCVETSQNNEEFIKALLDNGKSLENVEASSSKGLLSKIFT